MNITGKITGIKYKPLLCNKLKKYEIGEIEKALSSSAFILKNDSDSEFAISKWVSPKRTRSYPYERVYNTLGHSGKKITIIPFVKDEGSDGDRDFLQWDTISLMSLLDVNVIIAYYNKAEKSERYDNKITSQEFDIDYIKEKIEEISSYHSSALHWNMEQIDKMGEIGMKAFNEYEKISKDVNVKMHRMQTIKDRIKLLKENKDKFMKESRSRALSAQQRERFVTHEGESLAENKKATLTITNYLGGNYLFTVDEAWIRDSKVYLVEGKNTRRGIITSKSDIKDALLSMVLLTNLEEVEVDGVPYNHKSVIKLTSGLGFDEEKLSVGQKQLFDTLKKEAEQNNFELEVE